MNHRNHAREMIVLLMKNRNHVREMIVEGVQMTERTPLFLMNHRNHAREMIVLLMKNRNHVREMIVEGAKTQFIKLLMKSKRTNHSICQQLLSNVVKFFYRLAEASDFF